MESTGFAWAGLTGLSMLPKFLQAQLDHSNSGIVAPTNLDPSTTLWYERPARTWLKACLSAIDVSVQIPRSGLESDWCHAP